MAGGDGVEAEEAPKNAIAAFISNFSLKPFTLEEKKFVITTRFIQLFSSLNFNVSSAAAMDMYMRHSGGSATAMALHYGTVQSSINLCNMFLAPVVGCLSDTFGRKPFMALGRLGWTLWWLILANSDRLSAAFSITPLRLRLLGEVLCWGVIQAGTWSVYTAASADYFGTRPSLMGRVGTTGGQLWDCGQFAGSLIGAFLARRAPLAALYASAFCALTTVGLVASLTEPLPKAKRKPFKVAEANPIGSLLLLFKYGAGLRRLTVMTSFLYATYSTWSVRSAYRLGPVGMSSSTIAYINTGDAVGMIASQGAIVLPLQAKRGYKYAFQVGCVGGFLCYIIEGLAWAGSTARLRLMIYIAAVSFDSLLFEITGHCVRPMITKVRTPCHATSATT